MQIKSMAAHLGERREMLIVLLVFLIFVTYWPIFYCNFQAYDDNTYLLTNSHVSNGLTWQGVGWALTSISYSNWYPLTWISHMLDFQFFGNNPAGHHFTNLLFHAINAILLFVVLERMTGARWRSYFVVLLFALHPLR